MSLNHVKKYLFPDLEASPEKRKPVADLDRYVFTVDVTKNDVHLTRFPLFALSAEIAMARAKTMFQTCGVDTDDLQFFADKTRHLFH